MSQYQYIGTIAKPHGILGECVLSDVDVLPTLRPGLVVRLGFSDSYATSFVLETIRAYKNGALVKLKNVDTIEAADELREKGLFVDRSLLSSDDVAQFSSSLIDMEAVDASTGETLGTISDVWQTPAHRTLVIDVGNEREVLVPFVDSIVTKVDMDRRVVSISAPEGMFDLERDSDNSIEDEQ